MKSYISVILISALLLATFFLALPKTETLIFFNNERFDLNKKEDAYWKKEIVLELSIEAKDRAVKNEKVDEAKDALYKRLKKVGIEEIQIVNYEPTEEELENRFQSEENENYIEEYIKVIIQTTKDESLVGRLLTSTGNIKIMLPKENLDELSEEDQLQLYMEENYEPTEWDRSKFRNILINDLMAGEGERSYFGIFKTKLGNKGNFSAFLKEKDGERIGVLMDSFVIPIQVSPDMQSLFAVGLGPDKIEAEVQDIILNTGIVPVAKISVLSAEDLEPNVYNIDHVQVMLAILISIVSMFIFLYQRETEDKEKILQFAFSLLLIFLLGVTILKIWQIPVDLFLLIPTGILGTIFVKTMYTCEKEAKMVLIMTVVVASLMASLGTGYIPILGRYLLFVILLSFVTEILTKTYFKHIKIINNQEWT